MAGTGPAMTEKSSRNLFRRARSEEKFSNAFRTLQEIRVLSQPLAHEAIAA